MLLLYSATRMTATLTEIMILSQDSKRHHWNAERYRQSHRYAGRPRGYAGRPRGLDRSDAWIDDRLDGEPREWAKHTWEGRRRASVVLGQYVLEAPGCRARSRPAHRRPTRRWWVCFACAFRCAYVSLPTVVVEILPVHVVGNLWPGAVVVLASQFIDQQLKQEVCPRGTSKPASVTSIVA